MTEMPTGPTPWVGQRFRTEKLSLRILLVGESHYGSPAEVNDFQITKRVIESRVAEQHHGRFFGVVEQIVAGRKLDVQELRDFWDRVAFLNYAPELVVDGTSASQRHFVRAAQRLKHWAEELEPDLICFFSANAWSRRPWGGPDWNEEAFGVPPRSISDSATLYPFKKREILMARFNHPRALGAPMDIWHSWFLAMSARALEARKTSG